MKISIVIVSYNQGQFLEETILSVINQSYENKEVILIDGGSTDNSIEIIERYSRNFAYWVSEKDKGQSDAIVKGFNRCTGEVITWINSDDIFCEGALEYVAKTAVKKKKTDAVFFGDAFIIDEKSEVQEKFQYGTFDYFVSRILGPTISQPGTFFGREVYNRIGGIDIKLHYGMDYDLFCNFLFSNIPYFYTGKYMAMFRKYSTQKGHSAKYLEICNQEAQIIRERYGLNSQSNSNKKRARRRQRIKRILNGYYLLSLIYRMYKRRTLKEFNPSYSA